MSLKSDGRQTAATSEYFRAATDDPVATVPDSEAAAIRSRLVERFAIIQSELGGLFYEMAIRDHVRMDILMQKAAELQRVDLELAELDRLVGPAATEP
jgi:hypothetical protein